MPGQECRHNVAYWRGDDWWGVGPGAHSHVAGTRWWNVKHPAAYVERLRAGQSPAVGREVLDAGTRAVEEIMLGVRMAEGLRVDDLSAAQRGEVDVLVSDGLGGGGRGGRFRLTRSGRLLADAVRAPTGRRSRGSVGSLGRRIPSRLRHGEAAGRSRVCT